ncbi:MAG: hypothetical protein LBR10_14430 [Prevotellaceae bacterium]|nr:hypothetical protein [Prevotellaceae bacterium]
MTFESCRWHPEVGRWHLKVRRWHPEVRRWGADWHRQYYVSGIFSE